MTEYNELGWNNNVKNCHIPTNRSHMLSDSSYSAPWAMWRAGTVLGQMKLNPTSDSDEGDYNLHRCGKWIWVEFEEEKYLSWFLLLWATK